MLRTLLLAVTFTACASDTAEPELDLGLGTGGKSDGTCPSVTTNIAPTAASPWSCGSIGPRLGGIASDVNKFWGSQVTFCACGDDYAAANGTCYGAFSRFGLGYVYVGEEFMTKLAASTNNSDIVLAYVLGHELGHEVEALVGLDGTLQYLELTADCMAGYYLGSIACRQGVTDDDLIQTLATACAIADGTGDPVRDRNTHGTCEQRVTSIVKGLTAYRERRPVVAACGS